MGDELSLWNIEVMELFNEAFFAVWLVDIFHICVYPYFKLRPGL
jgi:hypothetical protein